MPAHEAANSFRPLPRQLDLDRTLSLRFERTAGADHAVRLAGYSIQLPPLAGKNGYAGQRVELVQQLDGLVSVWLGSQRLHSAALPFLDGERRPQSRRRSAPKPKAPRIYSFAGRPAAAVRP